MVSGKIMYQKHNVISSSHIEKIYVWRICVIATRQKFSSRREQNNIQKITSKTFSWITLKALNLKLNAFKIHAHDLLFGVVNENVLDAIL